MNKQNQHTNRTVPESSESADGASSTHNAPVDANALPQLDRRISSRTRYAVIRDNLRDGLQFLMEQDRLLAFAGELLDELRSLAGSRGADIILRSQILLQGLRDIPETRYKKVFLFGDGAHSPLKIHVFENGERKAIEIEQANLRQPGFLSVLQGGSSACDSRFMVSPQLAAAAIAEILNLRFRNHQQKELLEKEFQRVVRKVEQAEASQRRLFGNQDKPQAHVESKKSWFSRVSEVVSDQVGQVLGALNVSRDTEPFWEEIPNQSPTSNL